MQQARLGFIGAGWWTTTNHIPTLQQRSDVVLAAVNRRNTESLKQVQAAYGFPFATTDYRELLQQPLDGVVISTPHELHYEQARAALEAGLHVLVEKPLTLNAQEAWSLVDLARQQQRHLVVPHGWHYKPFVVEAKRHMDQGAIGTIEHVLCHMASPTRELFNGTAFKMENLGDTMFPPDLTIYSKRARGGGYAFGQLTHSVAMMLWLSGLHPTEVFAFMSEVGSGEVDMHDAISVRFAQGAIGTVSGSAAVPAALPFQVDIRLYGNEGMLLLDVERERMEIHRHDKQDVVLPVEPGTGAYTCEGPPNQFADLILGKTQENYAPGAIAAEAISLVEAAHRSAATNQPQRIVLAGDGNG